MFIVNTLSLDFVTVIFEPNLVSDSALNFNTFGERVVDALASLAFKLSLSET